LGCKFNRPYPCTGGNVEDVVDAMGECFQGGEVQAAVER
jgi:hypothetical protein